MPEGRRAWVEFDAVVHRLLQPVLQAPLSMRMECIEGNVDYLLAELALNRLDPILIDRTAPMPCTLADVRENWYAIVTQRRIAHPGVEAIQAGGIASLLE